MPSHLAFTTTTSRTDLATLWHRRLGHAHPDAVIKHAHQNFNLSLSRKDFLECDDCVRGKLRQSPSTFSFFIILHMSLI